MIYLSFKVVDCPGHQILHSDGGFVNQNRGAGAAVGFIPILVHDAVLEFIIVHHRTFLQLLVLLLDIIFNLQLIWRKEASLFLHLCLQSKQ